MKEILNTSEFNGGFIPQQYRHNEKVVFFDIETTGFSAASSMAYLIGCAFFKNGNYMIKQWFAQSDDEECAILEAFFEFLSDYSVIVHFNGSGFDIPFLSAKAKTYHLENVLEQKESFDIYKEVLKAKKILNLPNYKQKTIETFLGIERDDKLSGGELIKLYESYIKQPLDETEQTILLHNHDDIEGMLLILPALCYSMLAECDFKIESFSVKDVNTTYGLAKKEMTVDLILPFFLPKRISVRKDGIYMTAFGNTIRLCIDVYTSELKYFYSNYKDYYYLPDEDCSIHKSVAFYVDKNYRTKACAANCYSKKTGNFLPQMKEIITPYFKVDYHDKITYFELTDEFLNDPVMMTHYFSHLITYLME